MKFILNYLHRVCSLTHRAEHAILGSLFILHGREEGAAQVAQDLLEHIQDRQTFPIQF